MKAASSVRPQKPFSSTPPSGGKALFSPLGVYIIAVAAAASVIAIYSPALNFQFVLDDHRFVGDPRLQSAGHLWEYFTSYVWAQIPGGPIEFYRPLFLVWLRLNFILSETSSWGWHLLSVAKHLSVAVLLGLLVWKLLSRSRGGTGRRHFVCTASGAHGICGVGYRARSANVRRLCLSACFCTSNMRNSWLQAHSPTLTNPRRKSQKRIRANTKSQASVAWLIASVAAFMAALMAKETAIIWPAVLLSRSWWSPSIDRRWEKRRARGR